MTDEPEAIVFISYRRADTSADAGRLYDALRRRFGRDNVFMDVDSIRPGEDWVMAVEEAVGRCDALLALIGPEWVDMRDEQGRRRLDDEFDRVRLEIEAALKEDKAVIPVLFEDAHMPAAAELPDSLRPLVRRNATRISHATFDSDLRGLLRALRIIARARARAAPPLPTPVVEPRGPATRPGAQSPGEPTPAPPDPTRPATDVRPPAPAPPPPGPVTGVTQAARGPWVTQASPGPPPSPGGGYGQGPPPPAAAAAGGPPPPIQGWAIQPSPPAPQPAGGGDRTRLLVLGGAGFAGVIVVGLLAMSLLGGPGATPSPPGHTAAPTAPPGHTLAPTALPTEGSTPVVTGPAALLDWSLTPTYGDVGLDPGFADDPYALAMSGGGPNDASYLGGGCQGYAEQAPDFRVFYGAGSAPLLRFYFIGTGDTTLIVSDPDANWLCGDDSYGTIHPAVDFYSPAAGEYDIWVGTITGEIVAGTLHVTELLDNHP